MLSEEGQERLTTKFDKEFPEFDKIVK